MFDYREALRLRLKAEGRRPIERLSGTDRDQARRHVEAAVECDPPERAASSSSAKKRVVAGGPQGGRCSPSRTSPREPLGKLGHG